MNNRTVNGVEFEIGSGNVLNDLGFPTPKS